MLHKGLNHKFMKNTKENIHLSIMTTDRIEW